MTSKLFTKAELKAFNDFNVNGFAIGRKINSEDAFKSDTSSN